MKAIIQRVTQAQVEVEQQIVGEINQGLLVFLAVSQEDTPDKIEKMAEKILKLRIFEDENSKLNLSVQDIEGEILLISQFTLYADTKKGNRPSFRHSAPPEQAKEYYLEVANKLQAQTGEFGANMQVSLVNDGPVTIPIEI